MNLKKRAIILSLLVIFMVFQWFADINNSLVYEGSYPVYTLAPVGGNISLDEQDIVITNKDRPEVSVADKYILTNNNEEQSLVTMILPVQNKGIDISELSIKENNENTEYSIEWLRDSLKYDPEKEENKKGLDVNDIIEDLDNDLRYVYKNIVPSDKIWVYEVELKDTDNKIRLENKSKDLETAYLPIPQENFKVSKGNNYIEFNFDKGSDDKYTVALLNKESDDIKFECNTDYRKKQMRISEYVRQCINRYLSYNQGLKSPRLNVVRELIPHVLYGIDQELENDNVKSVDISKMFENYVDIISFELLFEAGETKTVDISYNTIGTYDKTKTEKPIYSYMLKLTPKNCWQSFGRTDITVNTLGEYKHMIESDVTFEQQNYGLRFTSYLSEIPADGVSYSLYSSGINLADEIEIGLKNKINAVCIGFVMILTICGVVWFAARKRDDE